MAISENEIIGLNNLLESDCFDIEEFEKLYQSIRLINTFKIKLIDFEFYNEKRLEEARKEVRICIQLRNYEKVAINRGLELECQKYLDLKSELQIEKSTFHYEQNCLQYFYFGTAKNDKLVREYFKLANH